MSWFTSTSDTVLFVLASTAAIYVSTLVMVRIAGRRTLAQLSAFDIIVTIALGTLVSSTAVSEHPSYVEGTTAIATLLGMQTAIAWTRRRVAWFRRLVDFAPEVLSRDGQPQLPSDVLGPQVTAEELMTKVREAGLVDLEATRLVVLEPSGAISVLQDPDRRETSFSREAVSP